MGAHASMHAMDTKSLAKAAEEAGVPVALRTKITENGIDGSMVLEYARLPEDELAQISKELFPDSLVEYGILQSSRWRARFQKQAEGHRQARRSRRATSCLKNVVPPTKSDFQYRF